MTWCESKTDTDASTRNSPGILDVSPHRRKRSAGSAAAVGVLLIDDRGWILLQRRDGHGAYPYHWATVGGAVEAGETLESAIRREVIEETGYRLSERLGLGGSATIVLPDGKRRQATLFFARYDGSQPIRCYEGLQITFVDPSSLDGLQVYPGQRELILEALRRYREGPARKEDGVDQRVRCAWARTPLSIAYHDVEWGVPVHDDRILFEFLTLEGAQAGLSWETILKKREGYRKAFADFDPARVARFTPARIERLLLNPGIVRNRLKIGSTVSNAAAFLAVQRDFGSFDAYLWGLMGGAPRVNRWHSPEQVPSRTAESDALSRDLLGRGFRFVGSTICYAFMQAVGIVNDHTVDCFRWKQR
jgi:DNA-3-methyladenine glycosylase I